MSNLAKWAILTGIFVGLIAILVAIGFGPQLVTAVNWLSDKIGDFISFLEPYFRFARAFVNRLVGVPELVTFILWYYITRPLLVFPAQLLRAGAWILK